MTLLIVLSIKVIYTYIRTHTSIYVEKSERQSSNVEKIYYAEKKCHEKNEKCWSLCVYLFIAVTALHLSHLAYGSGEFICVSDLLKRKERFTVAASVV